MKKSTEEYIDLNAGDLTLDLVIPQETLLKIFWYCKGHHRSEVRRLLLEAIALYLEHLVTFEQLAERLGYRKKEEEID